MLADLQGLSQLSVAFANAGPSVPGSAAKWTGVTGLGTFEVAEIAESLAPQRGGADAPRAAGLQLQRLDLRGTVLSVQACTALTPALHRVQQCNLATCRLRDPHGVPPS